MTDHAKRVATTLNRFVGMLDAAQCTAAFWILYAGDSRYTFAAQYGLQMTFGTAMLTLRKLQDLSTTGQLQALVPEEIEAHKFSEWVLRECERHKTRDAANLLFATMHRTRLILHYPSQKFAPLLKMEAGLQKKRPTVSAKRRHRGRARLKKALEGGPFT